MTKTPKKKKKATPRKPRKPTVAPSIQAVIDCLAAHSRGSHWLCPTGRERLQWWRTEGKKFPDVKAALATWSLSQINEFAGWLGIARATYSPALLATQRLLQRTMEVEGDRGVRAILGELLARIDQMVIEGYLRHRQDTDFVKD